MRLLAVAAAIVGLLGWWGLAGWFWFATAAHRSWTPVKATIRESGVMSYVGSCERLGRMDRCTFFRPHVRYAYEVGSRQYESTSIYDAGLTGERTDRRWAEREVAEFSRGRTVTAYVDPQDPRRAVLRTGLPPGLAPFALAGGVVWAAVWGLVAKFVR